MPTSPPPRVVRALRRPLVRRLRHLLALTAVALPLVASVTAPSGRPLASGPPSLPSDDAPVLRPEVRDPRRPVVVVVDARPDATRADARLLMLKDAEAADHAVWDALAGCESNGRWDIERTTAGGTTYGGGLQFADGTWDAFRPDGHPSRASEATREQQIVVAERVLAAQGWGAWPSCARRLGLR